MPISFNTKTLSANFWPMSTVSNGERCASASLRQPYPLSSSVSPSLSLTGKTISHSARLSCCCLLYGPTYSAMAFPLLILQQRCCGSRCSGTPLSSMLVQSVVNFLPVRDFWPASISEYQQKGILGLSAYRETQVRNSVRRPRSLMFTLILKE
jgi:hypothetical protein